MQGLDHLKSKVIFKFPFQNPLFLEDDLMLEWPFSDTILVTAYDLLKRDTLLTKFQREGSTLREYFIEKGFNKNIKIMADTGIFAFEFRKAKLDLSIPIDVPEKLSNRDIFMAYKLIDPDFLVAPDEIILWEDSYKEAKRKLKTIEDNLYETLIKFPKHKVFGVLQGIDTEQITQLTSVFEKLKIKNVARGGLLPIRRNKAAFQRLVRESEELSRAAGVETLHGFGMPSVFSLPDYFIDNSYDTIDTSTIYYYTMDKKYLDLGGQLIPVKYAYFTDCGCEPCMKLLDLRSRPASGDFMLNLFAHNSYMVLKLLDELMKDPLYLKKNRGKFYKRKIIDTDTLENYEDMITTAGKIDYKARELMDKSEVHKSRVEFLKGRKENITKNILVISSCSRTKKFAVDDQPDCLRLDTQENRDAEKAKYGDILLPAKELYQGYQHNSIVRALRVLRRSFDVDHFIISAGFGLISEDEYLPPYDCTFADRSPREVERMRDSLALVDNIKKLGGYDLVYLAMGRDYLGAFGGIETFKDLGKEIIYFSDNREVKENLVGFNRDEFSRMEEEGVKFDPKVDFSLSILGNLLQNFAKSKKSSFVEYWHSLVECNCEK